MYFNTQVISGLNKFDADLVSKVARAAAAGGGTHIDIACDPDLVRVAKAVSDVPVREERGGGAFAVCDTVYGRVELNRKGASIVRSKHFVSTSQNTN